MPENEIKILTENEDETSRLAAQFASVLKGSEVVSISGDLGAGKTTFVRGIARALGIAEPVTSPTFVLQKIYDVPAGQVIRRIIHYDFYRIKSYAELADIGFEDVEPDSIVLAEWGDKFEREFPFKPIKLYFRYAGETRREITLQFTGASCPLDLNSGF